MRLWKNKVMKRSGQWSFLSLITRRKKILRPKNRNMIDRQPDVVFIERSDKPDQQVSRKLYLKR